MDGPVEANYTHARDVSVCLSGWVAGWMAVHSAVSINAYIYRKNRGGKAIMRSIITINQTFAHYID